MRITQKEIEVAQAYKNLFDHVSRRDLSKARQISASIRTNIDQETYQAILRRLKL